MVLEKEARQNQEEKSCSEDVKRNDRKSVFNMLPKENRLKKKKDFEDVFEKGKGFKQAFLFLKAKKNNLKTSRFGFVVGKKVSNKAVVRNQIKRRLREAVRHKLSQVKPSQIKSCQDVVIVALPGAGDKSFPDIDKAINNLFKKAGLWK